MAAGFTKGPETTIHEGHVVTTAVGSFTAPDGTRFERDLVHHPGAVSVVPLLDDGRVVLVRQYRAAIDDELLEIPAGKRDVVDEPPEQTAGRELVEEVGLAAGRLELLAEFLNSPGFCDELSFVYLGTDLSPVPTDRQGLEEQHLELVHVSLADVPDLIAQRHLRDAKTIIGLLLALRHVDG